MFEQAFELLTIETKFFCFIVVPSGNKCPVTHTDWTEAGTKFIPYNILSKVIVGPKSPEVASHIPDSFLWQKLSMAFLF